MPDIYLIAFHVSVLLLFFTLYKIITVEDKLFGIKKLYITTIVFALIWAVGMLMQVYTYHIFKITLWIWVYIYAIGMYFLPCFSLLTSIFITNVFSQGASKSNFKFKKPYFLIFILPIIQYALLLTNKYHHLFYKKYDLYNMQFGDLTIFPMLTGIVLGAITNIIYLNFTIKNYSIFSKRATLLIAISIYPVVQNIITTLGLIKMPIYMNSASNNFTYFLIFIALYSILFKNINKAGAELVLEMMSDSFVTIDIYGNIISFNGSFINNFGSCKKGEYLIDFVSNWDMNFKSKICGAIAEQKNESFSACVLDKHYTVEINPILQKKGFIGTLIMFKDVTEMEKKNLEIRKAQESLIQKEKYASLGVLMAGVTHNLGTQLMSLYGNIDLIKRYFEIFYSEPAEQESVKLKINEFIDDCCSSLNHIDKIVKSVKNQTNPAQNHQSFVTKELVDSVVILMRYELKYNNCTLEIENLIPDFTLKGSMNTLIQVINNLVMNSIYSYKGSPGKIKVKIYTSEGIIIEVQDFGSGIPAGIRDVVFKDMVTTKGKNGMGLGLYISYAAIKGEFNGDISFVSEEGQGTTFFIKIPLG